MVKLYRRLGKLITIYALIHGAVVLAGGIWEIQKSHQLLEDLSERRASLAENETIRDYSEFLEMLAEVRTNQPWAWAKAIQKSIYQMVLLLGCGAAIFIAANLMERTKIVAGAVDPESATA